MAIEEIDEIGNLDKRLNVRDLIFDYNVKILQLSEESVSLADAYINRGAIPASEPADALHIAIASVIVLMLWHHGTLNIL